MLLLLLNMAQYITQPMEFFARSGAVCNAYTTFKNTTYLFYATESLKENIELLILREIS